METDWGMHDCHVTSADGGAAENTGSETAGNYVTGKLGMFYDLHPGVVEGDTLRVWRLQGTPDREKFRLRPLRK